MGGESSNGGYGVAGFIISIFALVSFSFYHFLAIVFGIIGLILCIIQLKKKKTGLAVAGLVISIVSILIEIVVLIIWEIIVYKIDAVTL